jgi:hypothetical protein
MSVTVPDTVAARAVAPVISKRSEAKKNANLVDLINCPFYVRRALNHLREEQP